MTLTEFLFFYLLAGILYFFLRFRAAWEVIERHILPTLPPELQTKISRGMRLMMVLLWPVFVFFSLRRWVGGVLGWSDDEPVDHQ
jgi:uncharacterized membrane protein